MSTKDLSILSYKELQALAVQYRIPGNIKKLLLVEILHAYKCGNKSEAARLLTDLKKNRKKRAKRVKIMKREQEESLTNNMYNDLQDHSILADHYLFPLQQQQQHQYPFQWVGAEEEVGTSKYDDLKCNLSYNDIRQIVFYSQSAYGNCDTNNNPTLIDEIMDLRTEATVSNYRSTLEAGLVNGDIEEQQIELSTATDNANNKMSLLLKKMLQAPVGANLEEIASPATSWSMDGYRMRVPSPDNSETMTAKSDIDENDEIWQDTVIENPTGLPCAFENEQNYDDSYFRNSNNTTSYYRSMLNNHIETNTLQGYDQQQTCNQFQFNFTPQADAQENCRNWLVSNTLDISNPTDYGDTRLTSGALTQYPNHGNMDMINQNHDSSNIVQSNPQYSLHSELYSQNQTTNLLESNEIVPDLNFDTTQYYQSSSNVLRPQESQEYYRQLCPDVPSSFSNDFYDSQSPQQPQQQQPQSNNYSHYSDYSQQLTPINNPPPIYHVDLENSSYDSVCYQEQPLQQPSISNQQTPVDPLQQVHDQQYENYTLPAVHTTGPTFSQNNPPSQLAPSANGSTALNPYWPRWSYLDQNTITSKTGGRFLENTLNLCTPNYVDYSKLNETCCVYSNKTPVMTLRKGLNSIPTIPETTRSMSTAEFRQHNFVSNWLLYNEEAATADLNVDTRNSTQSSPSSFGNYILRNL